MSHGPIPHKKSGERFATEEEYKGFMRAVLVHAINYYRVDWDSKDLFGVHEYLIKGNVCMIVAHHSVRSYLFVAMHDRRAGLYTVQSFKTDEIRVWPQSASQFRQVK